METNGGDIDNVEISQNLKEYTFLGQEIEIIALSPFAVKYMDNLQNAVDKGIFNKKIYILDDSIREIDNFNNEFNITGKMNDKTFNYEELYLLITLKEDISNEKIANVSCSVEKITEENYTLQCVSENELYGQLEASTSDLGKDILIINFLNGANHTIELNSKNLDINYMKYKNKDKGGYFATIIIIILSFLIALAIIIPIYIFYRRDTNNLKKQKYEDSSLFTINKKA